MVLCAGQVSGLGQGMEYTMTFMRATKAENERNTQPIVNDMKTEQR
jgi:hypothetical protein